MLVSSRVPSVRACVRTLIYWLSPLVACLCYFLFYLRVCVCVCVCDVRVSFSTVRVYVRVYLLPPQYYSYNVMRVCVP